MRTAIDARWIFGHTSGIGVYTRELIANIRNLDRDNEYILLFNSAELRDRTMKQTDCESASNFRARLLGYGLFSPMNQILLPRLLVEEKVDVYHSTNYMIPLPAFPRGRQGATACVVTIHDVIPLLFPGHAPRSRKARMFTLYKALMREVGRRADIILSDSKASGRDTAAQLHIEKESPSKIRTVYCGVSKRFRPMEKKPVSADNPDRTRMLLYVGRSDPYKNIATAVRALALAKERLPFPLELVIAGPEDSRYPETEALARKLGVEDKVIRKSNVSDDELVRLYNRADALIHPSRYEGFGLQVAEAMACGTPVVCSNAGSLPEVAGDAALTADPGDVEAFAANVVRILTDSELASSMIRRGIEQSGKFKWTHTAEQALSVYRELAK